MNKIKKKKSTHQLNVQTEKGVEIESDFAKATIPLYAKGENSEPILAQITGLRTPDTISWNKNETTRSPTNARFSKRTIDFAKDNDRSGRSEPFPLEHNT